MLRTLCLLFAVATYVGALTQVQLEPSGEVRNFVTAARKPLARSESSSASFAQSTPPNSRHFSPLQINVQGKLEADDGAAAAESSPWPVTPLCQFNAEGNYTSLVRVFVNVDNTRAFVFDDDAKGAQTKVQCHGATPSRCATPSLEGGEPHNCESYHCECKQATLALETIHMEYVKHMVHKVGPHCTAAGGAQILHIGLGGGAMSTYLLENCEKGSHVTSVERDPRVIRMAKQFFGLEIDPGRNDVENVDADEAVHRHVASGDSYDIILIDCFAARGEVPESCAKQDFIANVKQLLRPNGIVTQQVWASQFKQLHLSYRSVFGADHVGTEPVDSDLNYLITARG